MLIHEKIIAIMGEIGAIAKDKRNTQGSGYNYRGIDDVMNALSPLFIKHGVFLSPEVVEKSREERVSKSGGNLIYSVLTVKYTFYAADGSYVVATVVGEGMDSGDKASNKALAVAMKYAMFQVFCIPTEEMVDPDSESHEVAPKAKPAPKAEPELTNRPVTRSSIIEGFMAENKLTKELFDEATATYRGIGRFVDKSYKEMNRVELENALAEIKDRMAEIAK